jgi:hypothetical protein
MSDTVIRVEKAKMRVNEEWRVVRRPVTAKGIAGGDAEILATRPTIEQAVTAQWKLKKMGLRR